MSNFFGSIFGALFIIFILWIVIAVIVKLFKVKVVEVSTLNTKPKTKRVGRYTGLSNKYKKAMVKLAPGMTIEVK
jgi:large subunit ribosomal protein L23